MSRRFKDQAPADAQGNQVLPQAILTLTADPLNPDAFTIGMALAAHADPENAESTSRIHKIDVILMALINTIKKVGPEFKAEIESINSALQKLSADLDAEDADPEVAISAFSSSVGVEAHVGASNDLR